MKQVTYYQTLDGEVYPTRSEAASHADKAYGSALHLLAKVLNGANYSKCCLLLDDNIELMKRIIALKEDQTFIEDDED